MALISKVNFVVPNAIRTHISRNNDRVLLYLGILFYLENISKLKFIT